MKNMKYQVKKVRKQFLMKLNVFLTLDVGPSQVICFIKWHVNYHDA